MTLHPTPYGLKVSVEIVRDTDTDTARVVVHAPLYVNKQWTMSHSYASSYYSDHDILNDRDFIAVMREHYH